MSDKELFNETLQYFVENYRLQIKHPYNDAYFELYRGETSFGGMNPAGYNLLRNLKELCRLLEGELL